MELDYTSFDAASIHGPRLKRPYCKVEDLHKNGGGVLLGECVGRGGGREEVANPILTIPIQILPANQKSEKNEPSQ